MSSSEVAGVPEDSKFPLLGMWVSSSHFAQSGVATSYNTIAFPPLFLQHHHITTKVKYSIVIMFTIAIVVFIIVEEFTLPLLLYDVKDEKST
jgi:hypothetical protein